MPLLDAARSFLLTPARQAMAWSAVGIVGVVAAAGGVMLWTDGGGGSPSNSNVVAASQDDPLPAAPSKTATPTRTAAASPTASPTLTPTVTVPLTDVARGAQAQAATSTPPAAIPATVEEPASAPATTEPAVVNPTEAPTAAPYVPGTEYCIRKSGGPPSPPNTVLGLLEIGGEKVPAGTVVTMTFDGVPGPSESLAEAGGYRIDWNAGGQGCANQVGSAMALVVNGRSFPVGTVGGNMFMRVDIIVP